MTKIIALIGMPGSGKTEAARFLEEEGFAKVHFGGVVQEEVRKSGLDVNERNEREARERLRKIHGMSAMAKLSIDRIDAALQDSNVVIDGVYSMEEMELLRGKYGRYIVFVHIDSSDSTRHARLCKRKTRPLTPEECRSRDEAQIKNLNILETINNADKKLMNEGTLEDLKKELMKLL